MQVILASLLDTPRCIHGGHSCPNLRIPKLPFAPFLLHLAFWDGENLRDRYLLTIKKGYPVGGFNLSHFSKTYVGQSSNGVLQKWVGWTLHKLNAPSRDILHLGSLKSSFF